VFLNSFGEGLPKCKVAYSIRRSYLYKTGEDKDVHSETSKMYPLTYYYTQKGHITSSTTSFYYRKNDLIVYYIHTTGYNIMHVIPLYNYANNDYEVIISSASYNFKRPYDVYVVRAANQQMYICSSGVVINVNKKVLLYSMKDDVTPLFQSMPIANSFLLFVTSKGKEIFIDVIDLIKETNYSHRYSIEKVIDAMLSLSKENNRDYKEIESLKVMDKVFLHTSVTSSINNNNGYIVFYDGYLVNITLLFESIKTYERKCLWDVLSVMAVYQNKELTVELRINDKISIKTHSYTYEIDFGSSTILSSNRYKVADKYDITQSHLYSVIATSDSYTVVGGPIVTSETVTLYHKNEQSYITSVSDFSAENFEDILFIRLSDRVLAFADKDKFFRKSKIHRYYVSHHASNIEVIDTQVVRHLIDDSMRKSSKTKWVAIDITDIVKRISLEDKLKKLIYPHYCPSGYFSSFQYAYYIDYDKEELYSLVYFQCIEIGKDNLPEFGNYKFYLFKCKIEHLLTEHTTFRLIKKFEFETNKGPSNLYYMLRYNIISDDYSNILRLLSNKWNTGNAFMDLKIFEIYDKAEAYYDFTYNRISIRTTPTSTSIYCKLNLARRVRSIQIIAP
jgi:hypothetical protein